MKLNFLKKKQEPEHFLAIDIGTEAIKAIVFKKEDDKKIILGQALEYFETSLFFQGLDFQEEVLQKTIQKAIEEVQSITKIKTQNLILGLPSNILIAKIVEGGFNRKNSKELIGEKEELQIHQEVFKKTKLKLSNEFAQKTGLLPEDFHFLNIKILESKIDGYEAPSIKKMTGATLDFKILTVFLSKYHLEKIRKICQNLSLKILKIVNLAENFPHFFSKEKLNALFLDIGGQLTNVLILEKGKLVEILEFEKGGIELTKRISQTLGMSFSEARRFKHDFSQSVLSKIVTQRIEEIISPDIKNWFNLLKENLKESPKKLLPSNIFLFGGGSLLPQISGILKEDNWNNLTFVFKPKINFFYPASFADPRFAEGSGEARVATEAEQNFKNIEGKKEILNNPQNTPIFFIFYA